MTARRNRRGNRKGNRSLKALVKRELNKNLETKHGNFFDQDYTAVGSVSGTFVDLTGFSHGTSDSARIGSTVNVKKLSGQIIFTADSNGTSATESIRLIVGRARGAALSSSDMPNYWQAADLDKMYILMDELISINAHSQSVTNWESFDTARQKINLKFDLPVHYDGAVTAAVENQLFLYMLAHNGIAQAAGYVGTYMKDA